MKLSLHEFSFVKATAPLSLQYSIFGTLYDFNSLSIA